VTSWQFQAVSNGTAPDQKLEETVMMGNRASSSLYRHCVRVHT
jgi:hypothetical protein